jgi:hypothetical protein
MHFVMGKRDSSGRVLRLASIVLQQFPQPLNPHGLLLRLWFPFVKPTQPRGPLVGPIRRRGVPAREGIHPDGIYAIRRWTATWPPG